MLFPGQGSHYVGMGKSFHDSYESVKRLFDEASDVTGKDMRALCFEGPDTTLVQTDNVQPAITLVSLAAAQVLREHGYEAAAVAGHSVGEYAALCTAGVFSFTDAMKLVTVRGAAMKAEAERHPGSMAAIFGLAPDALEAVCAEAGGGAVQIANHNAPGQIVVTGSVEGVQNVGKAAKARGAKLVVPLRVSGPWHSRFMHDAQAPLREALERCTVEAPKVVAIANITASPHPADPGAIREALVKQIVNPVLWTQSMTALVGLGHRTFVEAGPGKVLTGLLKDVARDLRAMQVQDTDTLTKFRAAAEQPSA
jgi:[acyl-carrier-protein] S-malonyltransferase